VLVLFAAPLAVAPVFLYAWVGEMGFVSRHVFTCLAVGTAANLLARPVAAVTQAAGQEHLPARAAIVSIVVNLPLSLLLVRWWGVEGAALGSSLAMVLGSAVLLREARTGPSREFVESLQRAVARHWPLAFVCLAWGTAVHHVFRSWLLTTPVAVRYEMDLRLRAAVIAIALYLACLATMALVKVAVVGLDGPDRELVASFRAGARRLLRG
jgi:Na+-driven multidrug efflux pump